MSSKTRVSCLLAMIVVCLAVPRATACPYCNIHHRLAVTIGSFASVGALPVPAEQPSPGRMDDLGSDRILLVLRHPVDASHPYTST